MSTLQLERLREPLSSAAALPDRARALNVPGAGGETGAVLLDFLDEPLAGEIDSKTYNHDQMRIAMARFPFQKSLESFESKFPPSIDPG
jgi:hypothetical protein